MKIKWSPQAIDGLNLDPTRKNQLDLQLSLEAASAPSAPYDPGTSLLEIIRSFGERGAS